MRGRRVPLFVVATPIGNLADITERAREVLASCDAVVAEDTRHSGNLLKHLGIQKPLHSLPAFDEGARVEPLVHRLLNGESLALVTDAGTPAVSDPGSVLVRRAVEEGVAVVPVPGPSAAIAAVSATGYPEGRFHFAGFLPRKASHRSQMLAELRPLRAQLVFYESPQRLAQTLADLSAEPELLHLHLQALAGDLQQLRRSRHVAVGHFQPADDQVALDRLHLLLDDLFQRTRAGGNSG